MNRWCLLKSLLSARIPINRINALMSCLCKIHNFCIDHGNAKPLQHYEHNLLTLMDFVNNNDDDNPHHVGLLVNTSLTYLKVDEEQIGDLNN